jgi:tetratricopeptide (TPR) repeat protein
LALTIILPGLSFEIAGQTMRTPSRTDIVSARELSFQGDYDGAMARFAEMTRKYPESPAGEFYQAVTLIWKSYVDAVSLGYGTRAYDAEMETLLERVVAKAEAQRTRADRSKQDELEALYFLGSVAGARARASFFQNRAIPAAKLARTAQDFFDELLKLDPEFWDGYYAPGNIYYAVGLVTDTTVGKVATTVVGQKSLPTGDLARGLSYLKIAAEKSAVTGVDAKLALLQSYALNENRFEEALAIARELQARYPSNQIFARYLLRIYAGLKDRAKLSQTAQQILAAVKEGKPNFGPFMKAEAERYLAEAARW